MWWPLGSPKGACRLCKKLACTLGFKAPWVSQNCRAMAAWGVKPGMCIMHPGVMCSLPCTIKRKVVPFGRSHASPQYATGGARAVLLFETQLTCKSTYQASHPACIRRKIHTPCRLVFTLERDNIHTNHWLLFMQQCMQKCATFRASKCTNSL